MQQLGRPGAEGHRVAEREQRRELLRLAHHAEAWDRPVQPHERRSSWALVPERQDQAERARDQHAH
jgi:hypothetical protein